MATPKIFISSSGEGLSAARAIAAHLQDAASVTVWTDRVYAPTTNRVESLLEIAHQSDFAIFLLDERSSGREPPRSVNANLIFEMGLFTATLGRSRTFVVVDESSQPSLPSDLAGSLYLSLDFTADGSMDRGAAQIKGLIAKLGASETKMPVSYSSCFISYAWPNQAFAERLHLDLTKIGVTAWLATKDINPGGDWGEEIHSALQAHDRVIAVLSAESLRSEWFLREIALAQHLEAERKKPVLFPLRLDNSVFENSDLPILDSVRRIQIGDFTNWQNSDAYDREFSRLARALAISASVESDARS